MPPTTSITRGVAFEGMFVRTLQPTGAFAEALRAAGYDVSAPPRAEYPTPVWQACLEVARQHTFPTLPRAEGERRLGRRFIDGFFETLTGKMLGATLPMLGPGMVLQKLKRAWGSSQPSLELLSEELAPGSWRVTLRERGIMADFCAGLLEGLLERTRVQAQVAVLERSPEHCVLTARWSE
jgi:uncharacterized protein (TIGR02265 family)